MSIETMAALLDDAATGAKAIPQLTLGHELDVDGAYAVQEALIARRLDRGQRLVGIKLGLTSRAKMAQVGVHEVIWGRLTDAMRVPDGGRLALDGFIHRRIEPEVAHVAELVAQPDELGADGESFGPLDLQALPLRRREVLVVGHLDH